jgi:hypothetical protein
MYPNPQEVRMSESEKFVCKEPSKHMMHLCELRKQGRRDDVTALMADPGHRCYNCNAVARNAENLCNPSPFAKI